MNLILYKSNETDFDTLGIGVLRDFTSTPLITEVLKGEYILEFNYAKDGKYCEYLLNQNIIKALGQPFRIFSVDPSNDGYRVLAKHIYYDLKNNFLEDVAPTNKTSQDALKWILDRTVFDNCFIVSGDCTELASSRYVRMTPYEAIFNADNSILSRYGGEPEFDKYNIIIHQKRGRDTGVEIREGKNLKGIKITKDFSSIITKIYPVGSNGLVLPEKYVTSDLINEYDTPRIDKREFSDIGINDETSEEEACELLRDACKKLFSDGLDKPVISVSVDFIELSKTREYRKYKNLETLELGDTIRVYIPSLNQDYKIRVIKIVKNALTGTITNLELGNETPSLITYQNSINKSVDSNIKKNYTSVLAEAKNDLTKFINHPYNGHLIISEETGEIFIMDTTDIATSKEVWKFGLGGWGFSSSGIDGPYKSGLTKDGHFVADWITTGKMSIERIEGLSQLLLTINSKQSELQNEFVLTKTIEGNPIEVTDAGEYPLESIPIDGKSYQETTTGKNKFISIESATINGVTLTHNSDDSYDIVGTNSSATSHIAFIKDISIEKSMLKDNTNYTISFNKEIDTNKIGITSEFYGNNQWVRSLTTNINRTGLSNLTDVDIFRCYILVKANQTVNIKRLKIQLEEGEVATGIESYTGGISSPNPKYLQETEKIQGVTNIFDGIFRQGSASNLNDSALLFSKNNLFLKKGKYTFKSDLDPTKYLFAIFGNTNKFPTTVQMTYNSGWLNPSNTLTFNFTQDLYFGILVKKISNEYIFPEEIENFNFQLEKGSIAYRLVPPGRWLEQITIGVNKFNGATEHGGYDATSGLKYNDASLTRNKYPVIVESNKTYIFSNCGVWQGMNLREYDKNYNFIKSSIINGYIGQPFTTTSKTRYINFFRSNTNVDKLQLNLGDQVLPYEEYKENSTLINMNKPNLYNKETDIELDGQYRVYQNGTIGTNKNYYGLKIKVEPNTRYTFDSDIERGLISNLCFFDKEFNFISGSAFGNIYTLQTPSNCYWITLALNKNYTYFKLYEGYGPYYEFAEARDAKDAFIDGSLKKRIYELVLTGNENFGAWGEPGGFSVNLGLQAKYIASNMAIPNAICTHFIADGRLNVYNDTSDNIFSINDTTIYIRYNKYTKSADFKAFLKEQYDAGTPVKIDYELETPKTYQLNYEPLKLHKGYNYITLNDELYPNMNIRYLTDSLLNSLVSRSEFQMTNKSIRADVSAKLDNMDKDTKASLELCIKEDDNKKLSSLINAIADLIALKSDDLIIETTYFKLKQGIMQAIEAVLTDCKINGGDLVLNDDGISANSSIVINNPNYYSVVNKKDKLQYGDSLSSKALFFSYSGNLLFDLIVDDFEGFLDEFEYSETILETDKYKIIYSFYGSSWIDDFFSMYTDSLSIESKERTSTGGLKYFKSLFLNTTYAQEGENTNLSSLNLPSDFGTITKINKKSKFYSLLEIQKSIKEYSGSMLNSKSLIIETKENNNHRSVIVSDDAVIFTHVGFEMLVDMLNDDYSNDVVKIGWDGEQAILIGRSGTSINNLSVTENFSCENINTSGDNLPINSSIELYSVIPYIDFHHDNSGVDYTGRIIEDQAGHFQFRKSSGFANCQGGSWTNSSSYLVKKNIKELSDEEALDLLKLRPVSFDYRNGIDLNQRGLIAEEVSKIMPDYVLVPEDYDEKAFNNTEDENGNIDVTQKCPSIDYSKFVAPLIKLSQLQQERLDKQEKIITKLEKQVGVLLKLSKGEKKE